MGFRWNPWNGEHIARHDVTREEAEHVIANVSRPFPRRRADDRWLVWGPTREGRVLQVVYVLDEDDRVFVIHARPLTDNEKRRYRRGKRP